jgi:hypothetical protein
MAFSNMNQLGGGQMNQALGRARNQSTQGIMGSGSQLFTSAGLDPRGNNELNTILQRLGVGTYSNAASRTAFNTQQEGNLQTAVSQLVQRLQQKNYGQMGDRAKQGLRSGYATASGDADAQARAMGLGEGYRAGQMSAGGQQLARGLGSIDSYYSDPQRENEDLMQIVQLLQPFLQENPYLQQLLGINSQTEANSQNRQAQAAQGGLGGILGSVLGSTNLGGLLGGGRRQGGGSSMGSSSFGTMGAGGGNTAIDVSALLRGLGGAF